MIDDLRNYNCETISGAHLSPLFDPLTKGLAVQVMIPSSKGFQTERWRDKDGYHCMMTYKSHSSGNHIYTLPLDVVQTETQGPTSL